MRDGGGGGGTTTHRHGVFALPRCGLPDRAGGAGGRANHRLGHAFVLRRVKRRPNSGGRHKVLGSKALNIPPQTSTIASHLPKAVGSAYAIGAARRHRPEHQELPDDAIVYCSFGDASANHATAQTAFNTAGWTSYQSIPLPLLFVCEDNGIGISTKTPTGWIAASFQNRPGLKYFHSDGLDISTATRWRPRRRTMSAPARSPPSCISRPSVFMAMRVPMCQPHIFPAKRSSRRGQ